MNKQYIAILGIVLLLFAGFFIFADDVSTRNTGGGDAPELSGNELAEALVIGDLEAQATIIEYGDFKCPSCGQFHQQAGQELRSEYIDNDQLKIIFRPLAVIGPDSERAALGAYCANEQDGFTEYHDSVYDYMWDEYYRSGNYAAEFEDVLTRDVLSSLLPTSGMNANEFNDCLDSDEHLDSVEGNLANAQNDGVRGTPTFVISNQRVVGPQPFSVFKQLVDIQLQ